jgi:hypothetical protein
MTRAGLVLRGNETEPHPLGHGSPRPHRRTLIRVSRAHIPLKQCSNHLEPAKRCVFRAVLPVEV